jgi:plasmid stabilization system protein ParE
VKWTVFHSKRSEDELEQIRAYLHDEFGKASARKFLEKIDKAIRKIESQPESNPPTKKHKSLRRCSIKPYTVMFYQIVLDEIEIVAIVDSRRDFIDP